MEIRPPKLVINILGILPNSLPFENQIDGLLDKAADKITRSAPMRKAQELYDKLPVIPEMSLPTPFGTYITPRLELPVPRPPVINDKTREAVKAGILSDVAEVITIIPGVGDVMGVITDAMSDTAAAKIYTSLNTAQYNNFLNRDKVSPSTTLAVLLALSDRENPNGEKSRK